MEQATFTKKRLIDFLAQLQASPEDYLTVYISPSSLARYAVDLSGELGPFAEEIAETSAPMTSYSVASMGSRLTLAFYPILLVEYARRLD